MVFLEVSEKEKGKQEKKWWVFFLVDVDFLRGLVIKDVLLLK